MAPAIARFAVVALALATQACTGSPPAQPLSGEVRLKTVHVSSQCGRIGGGPTVKLIVSDLEWAQMWRQLASAQLPPPDRPDVNFRTTRVAVVSAGRFSTGGYGLDLFRPTATVKDGTLRLPVQLSQPGAGSVVTQALTWPCLVVAFPTTGVTRVEALGVASLPSDEPPLPR